MAEEALSITTSIGSLSPADILSEDNERLLVAYAINPKADPELLSILAAHQNWSVRSAVAESPNTPESALDHLADDSRCTANVAKNPNASSKTLARILAGADRGGEAYNNALANKSLSLEVIVQTLLERMPDSSAVALKSNGQFNRLLRIIREMDEEGPNEEVEASAFSVDADKRWG